MGRGNAYKKQSLVNKTVLRRQQGSKSTGGDRYTRLLLTYHKGYMSGTNKTLWLSGGFVVFGTWSDGCSTFEGQFVVYYNVLEQVAQEIDDLETMYVNMLA